MVSPESSATADGTAVAAEDNPLLRNDRPPAKTRRDSSLDAHRGYHTISGVLLEEQPEEAQPSLRAVFAVLSVLLVGVFISQIDTTLLLATIGDISSEFDSLQYTGWLVTAYWLAMCVAQPMYGKLSDIFGRKAMLQVSYFLFAVGNAICGLGRSMPEVITGRVFQGSGAAGMIALVSILITGEFRPIVCPSHNSDCTDIVPLREVAAYRSYVNVIQTVGRSSGGPIGGALAQTIGWRWAFLLQAPLTLTAIALVAWKLHVEPRARDNDRTHELETVGARLRRIDFPGAVFMSTTIFAATLILDMGGDKHSWTSPAIAMLASATVVSAILFFVTEKYWAKEPIFPLRLLSHKAVVLDYALWAVQMASQVALIFFVPLYFQITTHASAAGAGAYMIPAVVGNTVGGLITGSYVKNTGRYKPAIILSGLSAILCFALLLITWRGDTPVWQASFIFLGGFANGIAGSAIFVDLAASVDDSEIAIASSGLYLSGNIGAVSGVSGANAVFGTSLRRRLADVLLNWPDGEKIAEKAVANVDYVQSLKGDIHRKVVSAYVHSFRLAFVFSLCCATCALLFGLILKPKKLRLDS